MNLFTFLYEAMLDANHRYEWKLRRSFDRHILIMYHPIAIACPSNADYTM